MDGIDNPPFFKRVFTNKINTTMDASFIFPRRIGRMRLRMPAPRPRSEQIYFIGATNVPIDGLDPALIRPGRMGRHVWFRTPTKQDRLDVFDLYINKVAHEPDLDTTQRRDEIAQITNGYSPAMIDQVCSMALTIAHHDGRDRFAGRPRRGDDVDRVGHGDRNRVHRLRDARGRDPRGGPRGGRARLHGRARSRRGSRSGCAAARSGTTRRSRRRSATRFRSEETARLVRTLGAMAAERVFYGENSNGVGGDIQSATAQGHMDGRRIGDGEPFEVTPLDGRGRGARAHPQALPEDRRADHEPHERRRAVHREPDRRRPRRPRQAPPRRAQILGQAYVSAYNLILHNKDAVEKIADALVERREVFGDELLAILDGVGLKKPELDLAQEDTWPKM